MSKRRSVTKAKREQPEQVEEISPVGKFFELVCKANKSGKSEDARKLREWAAANRPDSGVWRGLTITLEGQLKDKISTSAGTSAMVEIETRGMRESFGYDSATEIEKLMINRVVMCWLRVMMAENYLSQTQKESKLVTAWEFAERSLMRANSKYIRAVESLARIRVLVQKVEARGEKPRQPLALVK